MLYCQGEAPCGLQIRHYDSSLALSVQGWVALSFQAFSFLLFLLNSSPPLICSLSPPFPHPLLPSPTLPSLPLPSFPLSYPLLLSKEFHSHGHCTVLWSFLNNKGTLTLFFKSMSERSCHVLVYFSISSLLLNFDCKFFFPHFLLLFTLSLCTLGSVEEIVWNIDLLDVFW